MFVVLSYTKEALDKKMLKLNKGKTVVLYGGWDVIISFVLFPNYNQS